MPFARSVVLLAAIAMASCEVSRAQDAQPSAFPVQPLATSSQLPLGPADPLPPPTYTAQPLVQASPLPNIWDAQPLTYPVQHLPPVSPLSPGPADPLAHPAQPLVQVLPPPIVWHSGVELGLSGSDGNNDLINLRLGGNTKRIADDNIFSLDMTYRYATQNSQVSANHFLMGTRDEFLYVGTPWSLFVDGSAEYDEFMGYQERIASHAGVGYQFIKTDATCFKARLGAGVSKDFSGPTTNFLPEGVVGLDFEEKLTARGKFTAAGEYFPSFENFDTYRIVAKAAYEWLIDPEWNLTFKIGILDRYDTSTTAKNPRANDIEYYATLLWKF